MKIPKTPFATQLSGSAKETQLRLRSIFQWKKHRPPVWLFALTAFVLIGCFGLVSCQPEPEQPDDLWDGLGARVVEIDTEQMVLYVEDIEEGADVFGQRCALDCRQAAQNERLIFVNNETLALTWIPFEEFQVGDTLTIEMYASQKKGAKDGTARAEQVQLITQRDLTAVAEEPVTSADLPAFLTRYISDFSGYSSGPAVLAVPEGRSFTVMDLPENPAEQLVVQNYNGVVAGEKGAYRAITIHSLDTLTPEDFVPGGDRFPEENGLDWFIRDMQTVIEENALAEYTVVSADLSWTHTPEHYALGPQLWDGRYVRYWLVGRAAKSGEDSAWKLYECFWAEYLGLWYSEEDYLAAMLAEAALEDYAYLDIDKITPLTFFSGGDRTLVLAMLNSTPHVAGMNNLVLGVWDSAVEERRFVGETYALRGDAADYTTWMGTDGKLYLLLTNTSFAQGISGSSGVQFFRFDGKTLERIEELPACALETGLLAEDALTDGSAFWTDHRAQTGDRGFDLYERISGPDPLQEEWKHLGFVPFVANYDVNEVSLKHGDDYSPNVLTLGAWNEEVFSYLNYDPVVRVHEDWEPVYHEGDYWNEYIRPEINAVRYYNHAENVHVAYTITVSASEFATPRGINTRSTREEVLAAYPELKSGDYWGKYPGEDYLWYCEDPNDFGPALLFFFTNDEVSKIVLNDMFN